MATTNYYSLKAMLDDFGVVEVCDIKAYPTVLFDKDTAITNGPTYRAGEWDAIKTFYTRDATDNTIKSIEPAFTLDTLKVVNLNTEGPTRTITGGMNAQTLAKYGKKYTIEATDALGHWSTLQKLYGANVADSEQGISITDDFPEPYTLVGTTYVINKTTKSQQPITILIPYFVGDGIFNIAFDSEGDSATFDIKGEILAFNKNVPTTYEDYRYKGASSEYYAMLTDKAMLYIKQKGYKEFISLKDDATDTAKTAASVIQEYNDVDNTLSIDYDHKGTSA